MEYRRGINDGLKLVEESDYPMWSRVDLGTAKPVQLFSLGGGPNSATSLTTPNKIDQSADFNIKRIEFTVQTTSGAPFKDADLVLVGTLLREYWAQIYTNQSRRSWMNHLGAMIVPPMAVAAAGASAYDPARVVNGGCFINVEDGLVIKGGEAFIMTLNCETPATDLTGLTLLTVLWGKLRNVSTAQV